MTQLRRSEYEPGIGLGIGKCPYDPLDNSTAIYVESGNPGDLPALYAGTNAEITKADAVIFRTDLYSKTTKQKLYGFKRTVKYDSKWLDSKLLVKTRFITRFKDAKSSRSLLDLPSFKFRVVICTFVECIVIG